MNFTCTIELGFWCYGSLLKIMQECHKCENDTNILKASTMTTLVEFTNSLTTWQPKKEIEGNFCFLASCVN
jgi:hypothetical protein